jgi:hypothetical protein
MLRKLLFAACTGLSLTLLAACGGSDSKNGGVLSGNNSSSSGGTPSAAATGGPATPKANVTPQSSADNPPATGNNLDVQNALSNLVKAKSFKGKISVDGGQFKGDGTLEVVTPDKFHLMFNGGQALGNLELISIGANTYTKTGNTWQKSAGGAGSIGIDPTSLTKQVSDVAKTTQATKGGTANVDGKSCQLYTLNDAASKSMTELCIANDMPLRLVASGSGSKVTITFSDFNSNIDIKAPI